MEYNYTSIHISVTTASITDSVCTVRRSQASDCWHRLVIRSDDADVGPINAPWHYRNESLIYNVVQCLAVINLTVNNADASCCSTMKCNEYQGSRPKAFISGAFQKINIHVHEWYDKSDSKWEFLNHIFSDIPTPMEIIPIPMEMNFSFPFPWESHFHWESHSHAHLWPQEQCRCKLQLYEMQWVSRKQASGVVRSWYLNGSIPKRPMNQNGPDQNGP